MKRIERFQKYLQQHLWISTIEISGWSAKKAIYLNPGDYQWMPDEAEPLSRGMLAAEPGVTVFLKKSISVPDEWLGKEFGLVFNAGGEGLLSVNGVPYHGIDVNRSYVPLDDRIVAGKEAFTADIELYNRAPGPGDAMNFRVGVPEPLYLKQSCLALVNSALQSLYYTVTVYVEAAKLLPDDDLSRSSMISSLHRAMDSIMDLSPEQLQEQPKIRSIESSLLRELEPVQNGSLQAVMHMVGQSHIDVAWHWPLKETIRKCSRTFSTVCTLMEHYPEYTYTQSQPQLFAYTKEHYPELYAKIKEKVTEGRWEIVGGMWVEPDLNIPSGESLVRQLLYGRQFFKEEFGVAPRIEWLPDTFGYCASLPQLLRKSGIDFFMTTKMNWNDTNRFPYDLFHWTGIDGTSIVSYVNHGLNENTLPRDVRDHWNSFKQKHANPEQMLLYGYGDGGGGVTREMLEYTERSAALPGLPKARFSTATAFFEQIERSQPELPVWSGDLYLELHRGTYTTHAETKRNNRKAEVLYREAEIWNSLQTAAGQGRNLEKGWKLILLNQFHDIIPGTSAADIYHTSAEQFATVFSIGEASKQEALSRLADNVSSNGPGAPYVVFNSLSWSRHDVIRIRGGSELLHKAAYDEHGLRLPTDIVADGEGSYTLFAAVPDIPSIGYKTIWIREQPKETIVHRESRTFTNQWDTPLHLIEFDPATGFMTRWLDKTANRELIKPGESANRLQLFHDRPLVWDAWDIDPRFAKQPVDGIRLESASLSFQGETHDVLHFKWRINQSVMEQRIILYHHTARVDFETSVDWNESHKLLKVSFPVDVLSSKATYEIPFGAVERATHTNTTWEQAQFEVCGQRWADLSESGYGVALLNDCKYGYDIKGNVMRLSLLRAPKYPDPTADQGHHEFVYSVFPHSGDWRAAHVVRQGYELNHPVQVVPAQGKGGTLTQTASLVKLEAVHVVLDTMKGSEDGQGTIIRLYESSGGRERVRIHFSSAPKSAEVTSLMEETEHSVEIQGNTIELPMLPYEVKTLKVVF